MRVLSHRIGREHNNRRSLLEPPTVVNGSITEDSEVEEFEDKILFEENNYNKDENDSKQVDETVTSDLVSDPSTLS